MGERLFDTESAALGTRVNTLHDRATISGDGLDHEFFSGNRSGRLLLEVCDSGLEGVLDNRGTLGLSVENGEHCECFVNTLATDQVHNAAELAHTVTDVFHFSNSLHYFLPPAVSVLRWPRNVRVIANSPSLWPTMFSET